MAEPRALLCDVVTTDATAEALSVSAETVMRDWTFAKAFLQRELMETL